MSNFAMNRRQALAVGGMGAMSLGMPGAVMGADSVDESGNAVRSEKSCIFLLLCGGIPVFPRPGGMPPQLAVRCIWAFGPR